MASENNDAILQVPRSKQVATFNRVEERPRKVVVLLPLESPSNGQLQLELVGHELTELFQRQELLHRKDAVTTASERLVSLFGGKLGLAQFCHEFGIELTKMEKFHNLRLHLKKEPRSLEKISPYFKGAVADCRVADSCFQQTADLEPFMKMMEEAKQKVAGSVLKKCFRDQVSCGLTSLS